MIETVGRRSSLSDFSVVTTATRRQTGVLICAGLIGVAVALRLALAPLTEGWDFHAYAKLVALAASGHNVYAMEGRRSVMLWAYPPLCLNMFVALSWVGAHLDISFRVMGKLPTIAADGAIGLMLYRGLLRRGHSERVALGGMALYLFNPLVIYNGAVVGRFDAIALAFLVLALDNYRSRLFAPAYAAAIAAKTFPLFLLPLLAFGRDRQQPRRLIMALVLLIPFCLPYSLTDPGGVVYNITHDAYLQTLGRLSWYDALLGLLSHAQVLAFSHVGTLLYPLAVLLLIRQPLYVKAACALALFFALNRTVYEQYLLWPLPFLIILALHERSRLAVWLMGICTVAGLLENEQTWSPFDRHLHYAIVPAPWWPINIVLAGSVFVYFVARLRLSGRSTWHRHYKERGAQVWMRTAASRVRL